MDNLSVAQTDLGSSVVAAKRPHTWVMSVLYIGTFGSFIGYAAAFPLLIKGQFPDVDVTAYAFLGALVGSLSRPLGGRLADRVGGARVTAATFVVMGLGVLGVVSALSQQSFGLFFACFMLLFVASGVGNGSTYRMIPAIFRHGVDPADAGRGDHRQAGGRRGHRHHLRDRCVRRLPGAAHLRLVARRPTARSCRRSTSTSASTP